MRYSILNQIEPKLRGESRPDSIRIKKGRFQMNETNQIVKDALQEIAYLNFDILHNLASPHCWMESRDANLSITAQIQDQLDIVCKNLGIQLRESADRGSDD